MESSVAPSFVSGKVQAPPSKSMTQRAIAAGLLTKGETLILNPSFCDDSLAAIGIATGLGAMVETAADKIRINGTEKIKESVLNCGESGLAIRMFSPVAALFDKEIKMTGTGSLIKRPMGMIADALSQLGAICKTTDGFLPIVINGPLKGGSCEIDGSISSQLLTGLLMSLPLANEDSTIKVLNLKSRPYIDMTTGILKDFGIKIINENYEIFKVKGKQKFHPGTYYVESDWSGGSFLLVAGAVNGNLKITGLRTNSFQSDMSILKALRSADAEMEINEDFLNVTKSTLRAFEFDATESPDLFPPLVTLASYCKGISIIKGVSRLKHKESDRAAVLCQEFGNMGISIKLKDDYMAVTGGQVSGAIVDPHGDHRIAMAAGVAALGAIGTVHIRNSQCVAKSYPGFFEDLMSVGAVVRNQ